MNTFHDFASCIYTTQGQFLCKQLDQKMNKPPMIVENFAQINTQPNEKSSICIALGKKLTDAVSGYNCSSVINNSPPNCDFQFKCKD